MARPPPRIRAVRLRGPVSRAFLHLVTLNTAPPFVSNYTPRFNGSVRELGGLLGWRWRRPRWTRNASRVAALHRPARNDPRQGPFHGLFRRPSAMNEAAMKAGARRSIHCWRVGYLGSKKPAHVTGQALSEHGSTAIDHAGLRRWQRSDHGSGRGFKLASQVADGLQAPPAAMRDTMVVRL